MDAAAVPPVIAVVHRSRWRAVLLVLLALMLLIALAAAWAITSIHIPPVHVVINGVEHGGSLDLAAMPPAHKVGLVLGLVFAVVAALLVVPVVLLVVVAVALLAMLIGMGLPMLAVLALGVAIASPLILVVLVIAWLLRRPARIRA